MTHINLIVLNCKNLEESIAFYEALGLKFQEEQHDKSPVHYSCQIDGVLLELYPTERECGQKDRVGLIVNDLDDILSKLKENIHGIRDDSFGYRAILKDPNGRLVFLSESKA